jgi:hypothetical protein
MIVLRGRGLKRILFMVAAFVTCYLALYFLHPGFSVAASPEMVVVGFSTLILTIPVLILMVSKVLTLLESLRIRLLGRHAAEISRGSEIMQSFSLGVENMRKRRLRTVLILFSIILMVSALISTLSITPLHLVFAQPMPGATPAYEGILFRKWEWGHGLYAVGIHIPDILRAMFGESAQIVLRAWRYSPAWPTALVPSTLEGHTRIGFELRHGEKIIRVKALWGLLPEDPIVSTVLSAGRWFERDDHNVLILSEEQAEALGIGIGDEVAFEGVPMRVIGIVSDSRLGELKEIDGEVITPLTLDVPPPNDWLTHLIPNEVLIMPYEDVVALGGEPATISLLFQDKEDARLASEEIFESFPYPYLTFLSVDGRVFAYSKRWTFSVLGWEYQTIPLVIVALSVFNFMLASLYERRRDIAIFGAIGLSPMHIVIMFLSEVLVYALVGGIFGFLFGLVESKVGMWLMPGQLVLNYGSIWVVIALFISIVAILISSAYPFYMASRLVTPSLERAWTIRTEPVGDKWNIPLPFFANTEREAKGILTYLQEFASAHMVADASIFVVGKLRRETGYREGIRYHAIVLETALQPLDMGVRQEASLYATLAEDRWVFELCLERAAGPVEDWKRLNRGFVDQLRKQLLLWRSLPDEEKERYEAMG